MKKIFLFFAFVLTLIFPSLQAAERSRVGEPILFNSEFEGCKWNLPASAKVSADGKSLLLVSEDASSSTMCSLEINPEIFAGMFVKFEADISFKTNSALKKNGRPFKFEARAVKNEGGEKWFPAKNAVPNSGFETERVSFHVDGFKEIILFLSLESVAGAVEIKNLKVFSRPYWKANSQGFKCAYSEGFRKSPIMRGAMSPVGKLSEDDLKVLGSWRANVLRFQINRNWSEFDVNMDIDEFSAWMDSKIAEIKSLSAAARKAGIKFAVDMHSPVGGRIPYLWDFRMFHDKKYADEFVEIWRRIARSLKDEPSPFGRTTSSTNRSRQAMPKPRIILNSNGARSRSFAKSTPKTPLSSTATDGALQMRSSICRPCRWRI